MNRSAFSVVAAVASGVVSLFLQSAAVAAPVFSVSGSVAQIQVGQTFSLHLSVSGLDSETLAGFDLDVAFDNSLLDFTSASFVDPVSAINQLDQPEAGSLGFFGDAASSGGVVDAFGLSGNSAAALAASQANSFRFLTLRFSAIGATPGTDISVNLLDPNLTMLNGEAQSIFPTFDTSGARLAIIKGAQNVPEPGTALLIVLGLLAFVKTLSSSRAKPALIGALLAAVLATSVHAQSPAVTPIDVVVIKVSGTRLQVRSDDGRVYWVGLNYKVAKDKVGMRLQGNAMAAGDTILVQDAKFVPST